MPRPTDPALDWSSDANYPAGGETWSATPTKVAPSAGAVAAGFAPAAKPPAQWINSALSRLGKWSLYTDEITSPYDVAVGGGFFVADSPLSVVRSSTLIGGASGLSVLCGSGDTGLATADLQARLKVPGDHALTEIRVTGRYARDSAITVWLVRRTPLGAATRTPILTFAGGAADLAQDLDQSASYADPAVSMDGPTELEFELTGSADPAGFIAVSDVIVTLAPA